MSILPHSALLRVVLGVLLLAVFAKAQNSEDGQGSGSPSSGENPADAGSAGAQTSSFSMSKGSFVAIITVVVIVAVLGISSAVLFFVAKKRQWEIRKSISRMSKRLTGRGQARSSQRQSRRQAVRMQSPTRKPRDLEKGHATSHVTNVHGTGSQTANAGWTAKAWGGKNTSGA
ncbi:MAG: hypothetical protein M1821_004020 [Bathelium mastoideum]|nr:MAG: hypothetical protein M1821_004020 [Bathelium mastoideum]